MGTLADALAGPFLSNDRCPVPELLANLDGEDQAALAAAFETRPARYIYRICKSVGLKIGLEKVQDHKFGRCQCAVSDG